MSGADQVSEILSVDDFAPDLRAQIDKWLESNASTYSSLINQDCGEGCHFDLEEQLHTLSWSNLASEIDMPFDRLRKKVEVARKLYRYYAPDLSRAAALTPLSAASVYRLCGLLLKAALVRSDARYLNTALKLLDGVLGRDELEFPKELRSFALATLQALVPTESSSS